MNNSFLVHLFDSLNDLSSHNWSGLLAEVVMMTQSLKKMSISTKFHKHVDPGLIRKEII